MSDEAKQRAQALHDEAAAFERTDGDRALSLYHQALALNPACPDTLYNIGLIHKYRGDWARSLDFNRRAVELRPDDEAAHWNLAIAATALCDWDAARASWHRVGIELPHGDGPIEADFGLTPVRLNPDGGGEVVWGRRIDPVRVRISNVPYPASGFRFGDVVLHDGAPSGSRTWGGHEYGVFNVLQLHQPSRLMTFELDVEVESPEDIQALDELVSAVGGSVQDWTATVRMLCKACSEGTPHDHHDQQGAPDTRWLSARRLGVAASDEAQLRAVLAPWASPVRRVLRIDAALEPPDRH